MHPNSLANLGQTTHGHCTDGLSPTYNSWRKMIERCNNPKDISYKNYGAKGIRVCSGWATFGGFLKDMGDRPLGFTLDRVDSNGDYNKSNCRWADKITQANNCSTNRLVTVNGVTKTMSEWSAITGVKVGTIWQRLKRKVPPEKAIKPHDLRTGQALKRKEQTP